MQKKNKSKAFSKLVEGEEGEEERKWDWRLFLKAWGLFRCQTFF